MGSTRRHTSGIVLHAQLPGDSTCMAQGEEFAIGCSMSIYYFIYSSALHVPGLSYGRTVRRLTGEVSVVSPTAGALSKGGWLLDDGGRR